MKMKAGLVGCLAAVVLIRNHSAARVGFLCFSYGLLWK